MREIGARSEPVAHRERRAGDGARRDAQHQHADTAPLVDVEAAVVPHQRGHAGDEIREIQREQRSGEVADRRADVALPEQQHAEARVPREPDDDGCPHRGPRPPRPYEQPRKRREERQEDRADGGVAEERNPQEQIERRRDAAPDRREPRRQDDREHAECGEQPDRSPRRRIGGALHREDEREQQANRLRRARHQQQSAAFGPPVRPSAPPQNEVRRHVTGNVSAARDHEMQRPARLDVGVDRHPVQPRRDDVSIDRSNLV